jgi:hypothetical protein
MSSSRRSHCEIFAQLKGEGAERECARVLVAKDVEIQRVTLRVYSGNAVRCALKARAREAA